MPINVLFAAPSLWDEYSHALPAALAAANLQAQIFTQTDRPAEVDYIVYAPAAPLQDFTPFVRAKAVLSLWAGVERIVGNTTLTQPLCRMVEPGLTEGMVEWVVGHTLRHHLGMDAHIINPGHIWNNAAPPRARERVVAVLGLGQLGAACAQALSALNFQVLGWSRTAKTIPGAECFHGDSGLENVLRRAEIMITLLPKTPETENLLNAERLGWMRPGAFILNPGRGALIDDTAILAALDAGQIGHATLDVFRNEPLPEGHAFWSHPRVTVTPHIAADTCTAGAARAIAENIRRGETGAPFLHLVDRGLGY